MLDIAEEELKIPIGKKYGTKPFIKQGIMRKRQACRHYARCLVIPNKLFIDTGNTDHKRFLNRDYCAAGAETSSITTPDRYKKID